MPFSKLISRKILFLTIMARIRIKTSYFKFFYNDKHKECDNSE